MVQVSFRLILNHLLQVNLATAEVEYPTGHFSFACRLSAGRALFRAMASSPDKFAVSRQQEKRDHARHPTNVRALHEYLLNPSILVEDRRLRTVRFQSK